MSSDKRSDCDAECYAEDRSDCFDMEYDRKSGIDPWARPKAMLGLIPPITVPIGQCSCSCHDEFDA